MTMEPAAERIRQERWEAARQARALLDRGNFLIWDTETTDLENSRIVSIAAIDAEGNVLLDMRLDPQYPISEGATAVHGLTDEMVVGCPTFAEVYDDLHALLGGQEWVIYNAAFDMGTLNRAVARLWDIKRYQDTKLIRPKVAHCAMLLYAQYFGEWSGYFGSFKWQKLTAACNDFDIQVTAPAHSALGDCWRTLRLLQKMTDWLDKEESNR